MEAAESVAPFKIDDYVVTLHKSSRKRNWSVRIHHLRLSDMHTDSDPRLLIQLVLSILESDQRYRQLGDSFVIILKNKYATMLVDRTSISGNVSLPCHCNLEMLSYKLRVCY
jgi:hypothetical protein